MKTIPNPLIYGYKPIFGGEIVREAVDNGKWKTAQIHRSGHRIY